MDETAIIEDVRFITDYPESIISDEEINSSINFTKKEIRGMVDNPNDFEWGDQPFFEERAVMWGTCYHLKVSTGEIGGFPIQIGDVDMNLLRQRGEVDPDLFSWYEKFRENFNRLDDVSTSRYGHTLIQRDDRQYGE